VGEPLECPSCGARFGSEERFCPDCRLPLVPRAEDETRERLTARQEHVRKIKPQYAEGQLVYVVRASNQAEAEWLQGLLLEEGIPSMLKRSAGFDVPDFMAAGPRDLHVPRSGAAAARDVLLQARVDPSDPGEPGEV
jgi:hypothetical protein